MLLELKTTVETTTRVEVKVPSFYRDKVFPTYWMVCEDQTIIAVHVDFMARYIKREGSGFGNDSYDREIATMLKGEEITEKEFFHQFDAILAGFQKSLIPSPEKISV